MFVFKVMEIKDQDEGWKMFVFKSDGDRTHFELGRGHGTGKGKKNKLVDSDD